jgi:hypothetical protein
MLNGNKPQASPGAEGGAILYRGTWDASANTPTLASGIGTAGDYYIVSTAGTTSIDGIAVWGVSDWAVFNGSTWEKVDNAGNVSGPTSSTDNAVARFNLATGKVIQNSGVTIGDDESLTVGTTEAVVLTTMDGGVLGTIPSIEFSSPSCPFGTGTGAMKGGLIIYDDPAVASGVASLVFVDNSSLSSSPRATTLSNKLDTHELYLEGAYKFTVEGHLSSIGTEGWFGPATGTVEAGAGSGASYSLVAPTDMAGEIVLTTGTTALATASVFTLNYSNPYSYSPSISLTPANAEAAALAGATGVWVSSGTGGFSIYSGATKLGDATEYHWYYQVIEHQMEVWPGEAGDDLSIADVVNVSWYSDVSSVYDDIAISEDVEIDKVDPVISEGGEDLTIEEDVGMFTDAYNVSDSNDEDVDIAEDVEVFTDIYYSETPGDDISLNEDVEMFTDLYHIPDVAEEVPAAEEDVEMFTDAYNVSDTIDEDIGIAETDYTVETDQIEVEAPA